MDDCFLSCFQTEQILAAHAAQQDTIQVSLDLGLTTQPVRLEPEGVYLPNEQLVPIEALELIQESPRNCFIIDHDGPQKIQVFSEEANKLFSLMPTAGAPTLLISGISMHRIKGVDPRGDAVRKIKSIAPLVGQVLDTATGLGYTAIEAAKTAEHVTTIEVNPTCLAIARLNPWSQSLFDNPKISQIVGDSFEEIQAFADNQFARVVHDPPSFSMAGELYSGEFYQYAFRVLQRKGRMFHYIGDLDSKSGRNSAIARGAMRRLQEAGFRRTVRKTGAFGVVAYK